MDAFYSPPAYTLATFDEVYEVESIREGGRKNNFKSRLTILQRCILRITFDIVYMYTVSKARAFVLESLKRRYNNECRSILRV